MNLQLRVLLHPVELLYPNVLKHGGVTLRSTQGLTYDSDEEVILCPQSSDSGSDDSDERTPDREVKVRRGNPRRRKVHGNLTDRKENPRRKVPTKGTKRKCSAPVPVRAKRKKVLEPEYIPKDCFEEELCTTPSCGDKTDCIEEIKKQFEDLAKQTITPPVLSDFSFTFGNDAATAVKQSYMSQVNLLPRKIDSSVENNDPLLTRLNEMEANILHEIQQRTLIDAGLIKSIQENLVLEFGKVHRFYLDQIGDMKDKYKNTLKNLVVYHRKTVKDLISKQCNKCKSSNRSNGLS